MTDTHVNPASNGPRSIVPVQGVDSHVEPDDLGHLLTEGIVGRRGGPSATPPWRQPHRVRENSPTSAYIELLPPVRDCCLRESRSDRMVIRCPRSFCLVIAPDGKEIVIITASAHRNVIY